MLYFQWLKNTKLVHATVLLCYQGCVVDSTAHRTVTSKVQPFGPILIQLLSRNQTIVFLGMQRAGESLPLLFLSPSEKETYLLMAK